MLRSSVCKIINTFPADEIRRTWLFFRFLFFLRKRKEDRPRSRVNKKPGSKHPGNPAKPFPVPPQARRHDFVNLLDSRAGKIHSRVLCFQRPLSRGAKAVGGGRPASLHGKSDSLSKGVGFNKKSYKTKIEFRRNPVGIDWIVFLL